jgi:hypothetical protein
VRQYQLDEEMDVMDGIHLANPSLASVGSDDLDIEVSCPPPHPESGLDLTVSGQNLAWTVLYGPSSPDNVF